MVIASGATIGDVTLTGFGYYEDGLWSDGFSGCLVDSSELAPHLLASIQRKLFNCSFDGKAAKAAARAKADAESGSTFRFLRTDEEQRADAWAKLVPETCADTPQVQVRILQVLEAVVAGHEGSLHRPMELTVPPLPSSSRPLAVRVRLHTRGTPH